MREVVSNQLSVVSREAERRLTPNVERFCPGGDRLILGRHEVPENRCPGEPSRSVRYDQAQQIARVRLKAFSNQTVPYGTAHFRGGRFSRHFVPGYDRCCPSGTNYILRAEALIKLALMGFQPGSCCSRACYICKNSKEFRTEFEFELDYDFRTRPI
jgi:hypothetical protein